MKLPRAAKISAPSAVLGDPQIRRCFVALALCLLLALGLQIASPSLLDGLRWQPGAIQGQYWRLVTGHFVHLSATHALLNLAALLLLYWLFQRDWRAGDQWLLLLSLPVTGLLLAYSQLTWYVGLSGVLHGWFLLGALRLLSQQRGLAVLMLLGLLLKLYLEPHNPLTPAEEAWLGGPVAYIAHRIGSIAILICLTLQFAGAWLWDRVRRQ